LRPFNVVGWLGRAMSARPASCMGCSFVRWNSETIPMTLHLRSC